MTRPRLATLAGAVLLVALIAGGAPAALAAAGGAATDAAMPGAAATDTAPTRRPLVVIVANNSGAETTDLLVPFAVLHDADVADVRIVAVTDGPVALMPGLTILPNATLADLVGPPAVAIVPAMHDATAAPLLAAVRRWAEDGVLVVSVCDGAWVLANAGVLDGRSATSHWYSIASLRRSHPRTRWRQDARWVRDGNVITSAGVSASLPLASHLVELLRAGREEDAHALGPAHDGERFAVRAADVAIAARNYLLPWRREVLGVPIADGVDELALGTTLDLLDRTYAVRTITEAATSPVRGRRGLRLVPDHVGGPAPATDRTIAIGAGDFDSLLAGIEARWDAATRSFVALQIEYPPGL